MAAGSVRLLDYCATGNVAVEGWLHEEALLLTLALHRQQRAAGLAGGVAEIGVYHGRFFLLLALCCEGAERALGVDLFDRLSPGREAAVRGDREAFEGHLATWGVADRTVVRQQDSLELTPDEVRAAVGAAGARLFSVDGAHSFKHAIADLRLAAASLAPGGVVLLDDFLHAEWLGVTEAAVALLREPSPPLAPLAICGGKLALCAPADHAAWMDRLGDCLLPYAREAERVLFCGVECWRFWLRSGEGAWALWGEKPLARLDVGGPVPLGGTLGEGWSFPETWGRWTVADRAECAVALPAGMPAPPRRLAIHLGAMPPPPLTGKERHAQLTLGEAGALPPMVLREEPMRWHLFNLPRLPAEWGMLPVTVESGQLVSPASLGRGDDIRALGVSLSTILLLP
ncbi:hypothetical protein GCM10009416_39450 [Craurococcus roseus]|uniref:Class I SAM-dependent methyltransferase n=1 Tax=Craurococcus roseus TaxID=77585 RepID=A0ABN1FT45_9PROT